MSTKRSAILNLLSQWTSFFSRCVRINSVGTSVPFIFETALRTGRISIISKFISTQLPCQILGEFAISWEKKVGFEYPLGNWRQSQISFLSKILGGFSPKSNAFSISAPFVDSELILSPSSVWAIWGDNFYFLSLSFVLISPSLTLRKKKKSIEQGQGRSWIGVGLKTADLADA